MAEAVAEVVAEDEAVAVAELAAAVVVFGFEASLRASQRCFMSSNSSPSALITTTSASLRGALH